MSFKEEENEEEEVEESKQELLTNSSIDKDVTKFLETKWDPYILETMMMVSFNALKLIVRMLYRILLNSSNSYTRTWREIS